MESIDHPGRARRALLGLGCGLALFFLLQGCSRDNPEAALRARSAALADSIEREPAALQQYLAEDFIGNGGLDRSGARAMALAYRLRYRDTGVVIGPLALQMGPGHATARSTVVLRGGSGLLPEGAGAYEVESGWRLEGGEWVLASLRWQRAL